MDYRSPILKFLLTLLAAALMLGAVALLLSVGLPQRADFTGYRVEGVAQPIAPERNALAPNITATTLDGTSIELWQLRGQPVLLNFWATWCVPCAVEMPELQALYEEYTDLHILAINLAEPPQAVAEWVDAFGLTFDVLLDRDQTIARTYFRHGPPATYVIAPDGMIAAIHYGPVSMGRLQDDLSAWLPE